jgi:hypothetical protein
MSFVAHLCGRECSIEILQQQNLEKLWRGCTSIVLLDLKESEAQAAAEELVEFAGTISPYGLFVRMVLSHPQS